MADRGVVFCPVDGPQRVEDERWEGQRSRLWLACGHVRLAERVQRRGGRWTLPKPPPGYRVEPCVIGPEGRAYPAKGAA